MLEAKGHYMSLHALGPQHPQLVTSTHVRRCHKKYVSAQTATFGPLIYNWGSGAHLKRHVNSMRLQLCSMPSQMNQSVPPQAATWSHAEISKACKTACCTIFMNYFYHCWFLAFFASYLNWTIGLHQFVSAPVALLHAIRINASGRKRRWGRSKNGWNQ